MPLEDTHAVNLIAQVIQDNEPGSVVIVPTGSLTNIALFARMYPELVERVGGVTLMGGGHHTGNMTPAAEFNILADPDAAAIVFEESWPVTMIGLDVTHQVLAVPDRMEQLKAIGTDVAQFIAELVEFFGASYMKERNYPGPPMHDPLAVAAVADPSVVRTIRAPIYVETQGAHARGQTIVDFRRTCLITTRVGWALLMTQKLLRRIPPLPWMWIPISSGISSLTRCAALATPISSPNTSALMLKRFYCGAFYYTGDPDVPNLCCRWLCRYR